MAHCVVLDDSVVSRGLSELTLFPKTCCAITIAHPLKIPDGSWLGTLSAGILAALAWIQRRADVDFVLRIDTDALAIGPFANRIARFLKDNPDAGVIGALGNSCNPDMRRRQNIFGEPKLLAALRDWPRAVLPNPAGSEGAFEDQASGENLRRFSFDALRPHITAARTHGYKSNIYCQGGACVIGRRMIDRMADAKYFALADRWTGLPFADDLVLAMYAQAVELAVCDCSKLGEPFGVQHLGLPYTLQELVDRGHTIIHSVKNDLRYSELAIRAFFAARLDENLTGR